MMPGGVRSAPLSPLSWAGALCGCSTCSMLWYSSAGPTGLLMKASTGSSPAVSSTASRPTADTIRIAGGVAPATWAGMRRMVAMPSRPGIR